MASRKAAPVKADWRTVFRQSIARSLVIAAAVLGWFLFVLAPGQGLIDLDHGHVYRRGLEHLGQTHGGLVVGSHATSLEICARSHRKGGEQALRRPRYREQRLEAPCGKLLFDQGALKRPETPRTVVAVHHEWNRVRSSHRYFSDHPGHDAFTGLHLAVLHGLADISQLEQRVVGAHFNAQRGIGCLLHIARECSDVLRVKRVRPVPSGQLPARLAVCHRGHSE